MYEHDDSRSDDGRGSKPGRSGPSAALIAFILIAAAVIAFIVQNPEKANIEFLFIRRETPVWVAILIALVAGMVLDRLLVFWWRRRRTRR